MPPSPGQVVSTTARVEDLNKYVCALILFQTLFEGPRIKLEKKHEALALGALMPPASPRTALALPHFASLSFLLAAFSYLSETCFIVPQ